MNRQARGSILVIGGAVRTHWHHVVCGARSCATDPKDDRNMRPWRPLISMRHRCCEKRLSTSRWRIRIDIGVVGNPRNGFRVFPCGARLSGVNLLRDATYREEAIENATPSLLRAFRHAGLVHSLRHGLDPVRVGRYSALAPGPSPEQAERMCALLPRYISDPCAFYRYGVLLLRANRRSRAKQVLARSGYRLASLDASCPSLPALRGWPLPAVHRTLGPMRLDEALGPLAGPAHYLVVDPVHRLVSLAAGTVSGPGADARSGCRSAIAYSATAGASAHGARAGRLCSERHPPDRSDPTRRRLWPIAAEFRKVFRATTEQIMVGLFETNPESFCYQNLHCLKARAYLDPPTKGRVEAMEPATAHRTVQRQFETWRHRARLPVPGPLSGGKPWPGASTRAPAKLAGGEAGPAGCAEDATA